MPYETTDANLDALVKRRRAFLAFDAQHPTVAGIFVSYRRIDSRVYAGRLFDRLTNHFGRQQVFMDIEGSIARGVDFTQQIEHAINSAAAVVVVIGRQWVNCTDDSGKRRLENADDWVRREIDVAIKRNVLLLPVLVDGASMPAAEQLPDELQLLTHRQASEISDSRWDYDVGEVIKVLEHIIPVRPSYWWLKWAIISVVIVLALCLLGFLPILLEPSSERPPLHGQFSGIVKAMKGDEPIAPTRASLMLDLAGTVVSGSYHNDTGDQGLITGQVDGNSLDLRFLSSKFQVECALRGTLSSDNSKIEAIYTCPDGEQGKVTLLRQ